ncbi:hypothetical protein ABT093_16300 [Kitasatospora sp. NPDC002551]|uniref:hypothetical protein n=1 Tax=Kitasatospora sp. NPDC002551 TaxID=3154539 RepID=UPI00332712F6
MPGLLGGRLHLPDAAQRALVAVQAERRTHLASLAAFSGDLEAVRQGLCEDVLAESARLEEAERQARPPGMGGRVLGGSVG